MRRFNLKCYCPKCGNGGEWYTPTSLINQDGFSIHRQCKVCAHEWDEATLDAPKEKAKRGGLPIPAFFKRGAL